LPGNVTSLELSMIKRISQLALAAVFALALAGPSRASLTPVTSDAGGGTVDVLGTATGATVTTDSYTDDKITSVNGSAVNFLLTMDYTLTGPNSTTVTGGSGSKTISFGSDSVTLSFTISSGFASGSHLNADGTITGIGSSTTITVGTTVYDFSPLVGGGISLSNDKVGTNFATIFHNAGASAIAAGGGVHEAAVAPEPSTMAIFGLGLAGFFVVHRLRKRPAVA
jgi:hypothetical protein